MRPIQHPSPSNHLLTVLPRQYREHFIAGCELVELAFDEVLAEPGERIRHVYFPTESFISLTSPTQGNGHLEVGLIGDEGMLGSTLILGLSISPLHALVQGPGAALRMSAESFLVELERNPDLQQNLKRYLYVTLAQLAQTAACSHFHVVEARLARWLLMTQDRAHSNNFHVTQQFLSSMLGVRRVGISKAATSLQNRKLIRYSRGNMTILDRDGLEATSCECYKADRATYNAIMN